MTSSQAGGLRLPDFIVENEEEIVYAWEKFARATRPRETLDGSELRDGAIAMFAALVAYMRALQSPHSRPRSEEAGDESVTLANAALQHAKERIWAGFDAGQIALEFHALRSSVIGLWRASRPELKEVHVEDLIRFNEAIDQLVAISVEVHGARVEQVRRLYMSIIGHDLRQPLCSVRLLVSALIRMGDAIESPPVLAKIQQSVESLDQLVQDLVDLGSMRLGAKMRIYPQSMDLAALAEETLIKAESANPERNFKLSATGDLRGDWDDVRLRQLLMNLLGNAAQYGSKVSAVELTIQPTADDEGVEIVVRNQGRPIPMDALSVLFEPSSRQHELEASKLPGYIGLGLYICREIVRAHQGTIAVESTEDGMTVISIGMPRVTASSTEELRTVGV